MKSERFGADAFQQSLLTSLTFLTVFTEFAVFLILEMMNYCSNNKYTWFSWAILHNFFCPLYWYSHIKGVPVCKWQFYHRVFSHLRVIDLARYAARGFLLGRHKWKQLSLPRTRSCAHVPGIHFTTSKCLHIDYKASKCFAGKLVIQTHLFSCRICLWRPASAFTGVWGRAGIII